MSYLENSTIQVLSAEKEQIDNSDIILSKQFESFGNKNMSISATDYPKYQHQTF